MISWHRQEANLSALWGLVLAAGDGKRLQPYIRATRGTDLPKQYVNFIGRRSMLEHTFERAEQLIPRQRILTVVSQAHQRHREVRCQLASRASDTVIVQPMNKETGPGILLPLLHLHRRDPQAMVAVFPSDHFIIEEERFMDHVALAARAVAHDPSRIVLLAMEAQAAEAEYGYILPAASDGQFNLWGMRHATSFVEKPNPRLAGDLITAGGLWNTMIMVFKVQTLLTMMQQLCPATYEQFATLGAAIGTATESRAVAALYRQIAPMNFSKDFLEKVSERMPRAINILPVLQVFWSDWGSPERIEEVLARLERPRSEEITRVRVSRNNLAQEPAILTF